MALIMQFRGTLAPPLYHFDAARVFFCMHVPMAALRALLLRASIHGGMLTAYTGSMRAARNL